MPHDMTGRELKAGDVVTLECVVVAVNPHPEYCNVELRTALPLYPGKNHTSIHAVNTRMTRFVREGEPPADAPAPALSQKAAESPASGVKAPAAAGS